MTLGPDFFERPALAVARDLIGKYLVRRIGGKTTAHMITEVEAYVGPHDLACHASKGLTPRTKVMFGPPGNFYVYFTYGLHWLLNVVTGKEGYPSAVLIRGLEDVSGPARLTKKLGITGALNGASAKRSTGLWIEDRGIKVPPRRILRTPRIGVDYAGEEWAGKPYRFLVVDKILEGSIKKK
jgi:DNA-3-methyladenine glycosylase